MVAQPREATSTVRLVIQGIGNGMPAQENASGGRREVFLDAEAHALQRWQAVAIFEVTDKAIHVEAKPPYPGRYLFRPEGPDARPRLVHPRRFGLRPRPSKPPLYLAPADAPDVVLQRQRRDQLKRFRTPQ